jgi:(p)ppGpp synthase/HD superfamily hydrolase
LPEICRDSRDLEDRIMSATPQPILSDRFPRAVRLAVELHRGQARKGTATPYVAHVLGVASLALEHGADEDEAIAALLHDGPEDNGGIDTLNRIRVDFGERVAHIVDGCTDTYEDPKPPWLARKRAYVEHATAADESIVLVSAADKLYNATSLLADLRTFGDAVWHRFNAQRSDVLWYYRALVAAYAKAARRSDRPGVHLIVGRLDGLVATLESETGPRSARA